MVREELVEMEKAEAAVKKEVEKKGVKKGEETAIDIESTELTVVGNIPVYEIKGFASVTFRRGYSKESTGKKHFKAQVNAESGKVVGFKEEWFEPTGGVAH